MLSTPLPRAYQGPRTRNIRHGTPIRPVSRSKVLLPLLQPSHARIDSTAAHASGTAPSALHSSSTSIPDAALQSLQNYTCSPSCAPSPAAQALLSSALEAVQAVANRHGGGIWEVGVAGSMARGTGVAGSDGDFVVFTHEAGPPITRPMRNLFLAEVKAHLRVRGMVVQMSWVRCSQPMRPCMVPMHAVMHVSCMCTHAQLLARYAQSTACTSRITSVHTMH